MTTSQPAEVRKARLHLGCIPLHLGCISLHLGCISARLLRPFAAATEPPPSLRHGTSAPLVGVEVGSQVEDLQAEACKWRLCGGAGSVAVRRRATAVRSARPTPLSAQSSGMRAA